MFKRFPLWLCVLLTPLILSSCAFNSYDSDTVTKPKKHSKKEEKAPSYSTHDYLDHLSKASLAASDSDTKASHIKPDTDVLVAYPEQESIKDSFQLVFRVDYANAERASATQYVYVPAGRSAESMQLAALTSAIKEMNARGYSVQDFRLLAGKVKVKSWPELSTDMNAIRRELTFRNRALERQMVALTPLREAELQIAVARHFLAKKMQEPSYLALENARKTLAIASASANSASEKQITELTGKLDVLENELHEKLPY